MIVTSMEWHFYDTAELHVVKTEHGEVGKYPGHGFYDYDKEESWYCLDCSQDPRDPHVKHCDVDVTREYRNLMKNLSVVIAMAAAAQQAKEELKKTMLDWARGHK